MIGRMYGFGIAAQAQTTAKTLIELASAADGVTILERANIGQSTFDTSENLSAKIQRVTTTGTGTTSTTSVAPFQVGDAAFGGVVETNSTIEPTYTANTALVIQGFNCLSGWLWTPANDDEIIVLSPSALLGIMLNTTATSMSFDYGMTVREIGG
jgi:hypothetical protein